MNTLKKRLAARVQSENAVDHTPRVTLPESLSLMSTKVTDAAESLKVIHQRCVKNSVNTTASIETENLLSESLGLYASRLRLREGYDEVMVRCLGDLKDLVAYVQELREEQDRALKSKFVIPMNEFVKGDIRTAKGSVKKLEKAHSAYDACLLKVQQQTAKGKQNLVKVVEAEKERDQAESIYQQQCQETNKVLTDVLMRNQIETLEQLCDYFEEYRKFFHQGHKRMREMQAALKEYNLVVNRRKAEFRRLGGKVVERVRVAPDTLTFKDLDATLWEKETDKKKAFLIQLVEDEMMYVRLLKSLQENYRNPMLDDDQLSKKIERDDIYTMFTGIDDLYLVHNQLYKDRKSVV